MQSRLDEQIRRNIDSRDAWERFAPHRERVTRLLLNAAPAGGRLCVLGAGNCNDLDLAKLTPRFAEVHLVDCDATALAAGVARYSESEAQRVKLHGGVDLSGIADAATDFDSLLTAVQNATFALDGPFTVTASVCLLSQLIELAAKSLGPQHPRLPELILAVRARHLRLLTDLTQPGGAAILITDVVSSDTYPQLKAATENEFASLVATLILRGNFFTGLNPLPLATAWRDDPQLAGKLARVDLVPPWLWDLGPRQYAVYAAIARRTG